MGKSTINGTFSIAMLVYQRVYTYLKIHCFFFAINNSHLGAIGGYTYLRRSKKCCLALIVSHYIPIVSQV